MLPLMTRCVTLLDDKRSTRIISRLFINRSEGEQIPELWNKRVLQKSKQVQLDYRSESLADIILKIIETHRNVGGKYQSPFRKVKVLQRMQSFYQDVLGKWIFLITLSLLYWYYNSYSLLQIPRQMLHTSYAFLEPLKELRKFREKANKELI